MLRLTCLLMLLASSPVLAQDGGVPDGCMLPRLLPEAPTITEDHPGWLETPVRVRGIERRQPDGTFAEISFERVGAPAMELTLDDRTVQWLQPMEPLVAGEVYRLSGICESGSEYWDLEYEVVPRAEAQPVFDISRGEPRGNEAFLVLHLRDEEDPRIGEWQWWVTVDGPDGYYYPEILTGSRFWVRGLDCGGFGSSGLSRGTHSFEVHSAPIGVRDAVVVDGPVTYSFECTEDPEPIVDLGCDGCGCSTTGAGGGLYPALVLVWLVRRRRRAV